MRGDSAKLTHIVGSGQANKSEILRFNGTAIATNPFRAVQGPNWDNPTYLLTPTAFPGLENLTQVTTSVDHQGFSTFDCLTWAAIVYRTDVKDRDGDGLLDIWESSDDADPRSERPGAAESQGHGRGSGPQGRLHRARVHVHRGRSRSCDRPPELRRRAQARTLASAVACGAEAVGDAFANCARCQSRWAPGIALHIDAGHSYPAGEADPYIIRGEGLARGGEAINELVTVCARGETDPPGVCQFSAYPGTVGWKTGFRFLRDEVLSGPPVVPGADDPCDQPGSTCVRRFDRNRLRHVPLRALRARDRPAEVRHAVPRRGRHASAAEQHDRVAVTHRSGTTPTSTRRGPTPASPTSLAATSLSRSAHSSTRMESRLAHPSCRPARSCTSGDTTLS